MKTWFKNKIEKWDDEVIASNEQNQPSCLGAVTSSVFCQDNLELLKSQPDESVDLIYCDILYGTGRKFADFQDLKPIRSEIESHYIPRIKEMHRVLKSTGSIYLQMDWRINHWIRCLLDDIFGYSNFRNEIIWGYRSQGLGKTYIKQHDNILFYTKTNEFTFNNEFERIRFEKKFMDVKQDEFGYYRDVRIRDVWEDIKFLNSLQNESKKYKYNTKKPIKLIERIINTSSNEGDLVADYYLGSGTTAVVCKELNRNFIGCDINPKAIEITNARLDALSVKIK